MSLVLVLALVARIAASCGSSVLQKRLFQQGKSSSEVVAGSLLVLLVLLTPAWVAYGSRIPSLPFAFWIVMLAACLADAFGNILLVRAMGRGEMSIVGPLNSYKPLVGLLLGIVCLHELPSTLGVLGMFTILAGSWILAAGEQAPVALPGEAAQQTGWRGSEAIRDRLGSVVLTAVASIFLKEGIRTGGEMLTFCFWALGCFVTSAGILLLQRRARRRSQLSAITVRPDKDWAAGSEQPAAPNLKSANTREQIVGLGILFLILQGMTVIIFRAMPVGYALALFQLGSVIQIYLGWRYFEEEKLARRLLAGSIMTIGAIGVLLAK